MNIGARAPRTEMALRRRGLLLPFLLIAILLLASALRFHRLGEQSLWYDEGVAYAHSLRALPELIPHLQRNVHLPAYFGLLGIWQDWTGSSEFALRALSALFSIVSVAWSYALGKRLFHAGAGLSAAAFVALNSFSIYYGQEARMYAMLAAIAAGGMWLFVGIMKGRQRHGWRNALALGLINALGIYTHIAYALVMLTQALLALACLGAAFITERRNRRAPGDSVALLLRIVLANALTLLLFAPWLPVSLRQVFAQPNLSAPLAVDQMLRIFFGHFATGITFEHAIGNLGFVVVFLLLFGLLPAPGRRGIWNLLLPLAWLVVSVASYLYLGLTTRYLRFLLPAQLAFALLLGRGVWLLWLRPVRDRHIALSSLPKAAALLASATLLLAQFNGLGALYHHADFQRDDARGLVARIEAELRANDALLISAAGLQEVLGYYYQGAAPLYALPTSSDAETTRSQVRDIISRHERIAVVLYGVAEQDPNRSVETTLNSDAYEIDDRWVDDFRYLRYAGAAPLDAPKQVDLRFGDDIVLLAYAMSGELVEAGEALRLRFEWSAAQTPGKRYKVFLQLLDAAGNLLAQRDSEPAAGSAPTTNWPPGDVIVDRHALLIPEDLAAGDYELIAGLYDRSDPAARLSAAGNSYIRLGTITLN